ncbi:MAG: hypothetical protein WDN45_01000 [Caulobacteraceae bacterium]
MDDPATVDFILRRARDIELVPRLLRRSRHPRSSAASAWPRSD